MQELENFFKRYLILVEAKWEEQVKENFRSQSYYGNGWKSKTPYPGSKAKILYKTGDLQSTVKLRTDVSQGKIICYSPTDYAAYNNEGANITVTPQMKKFFWAMHYKAAGAVTKTKRGATAATKRNAKMLAEAEYWKNMALIKVGSVIKLPERRFVGFAPELHKAVDDAFHTMAGYLAPYLFELFNPKTKFKNGTNYTGG